METIQVHKYIVWGEQRQINCIALWLYGKKNISNMLFKDFSIIFLFFQKIHGKTANCVFFLGGKPVSQKFQTTQA